MSAPAGRGGDGLLRWLRNKALYSLGFGLLVVFLIGLALFRFSDFRRPEPDVVRIAYGAGGPVRQHFLEEMQLHGRKWNLKIELVTTQNADETLSLIDRRAADAGLIAGGIEDLSGRRVVEITPLYVEPLQLVVKAEFYEAVSKDFGQLKGRTISMDGVDSATSVLATELLRFIGLNDPVTGKPLYQPVRLRQAQLTAQKDRAALPDAIFQIGGVPSRTIAGLVTSQNYRVVALPFGGAFNLSKFRESGMAEANPDSRLALNKSFVEEAVIPAFVYDVLPAVPEADTRTVATRLLLVGGEQLKTDVVKRMLGLIMSPEISHIVEPQLTVKLLDTAFQFERHPGTTAYLKSLEPFNVDGAFDNYGRMVEIWGILVGLYLAVSNALRWWKDRNDRKSRHSVGEYLSQILAVEDAAAATASKPERRGLDQRLSAIKKEAIELYLDGRLEDAEDLQSLLVTLADARTRVWAT